MIPYEFMVGKIRCVAISDGSDEATAVEMTEMFPAHPETEAFFAAQPQPIEFGLNCLLIQSSEQSILIDTGNGTLSPSRTPQLINNLLEAGITPEQVDIVVLTHGHGDHIGGVVNDEGQRVFPNARHVMTRLDWDHWTGPALRPVSERCLLPLKDYITLIEPDEQIAHGVRAVPALGHTPGHIAILVESEGGRLIHFADAMHHPAQVVNPNWSPHFDTNPTQSVQSRCDLLEKAAQEKCQVMAYHFPYPGLGNIHSERDGYQFIPLKR